MKNNGKKAGDQTQKTHAFIHILINKCDTRHWLFCVQNNFFAFKRVNLNACWYCIWIYLCYWSGASVNCVTCILKTNTLQRSLCFVACFKCDKLKWYCVGHVTETSGVPLDRVLSFSLFLFTQLPFQNSDSDGKNNVNMQTGSKKKLTQFRKCVAIFHQIFFRFFKLFRWFALKRIQLNSIHITMAAVMVHFGRYSTRCRVVPHSRLMTGEIMWKWINCSLWRQLKRLRSAINETQIPMCQLYGFTIINWCWPRIGCAKQPKRETYHVN